MKKIKSAPFKMDWEKVSTQKSLQEGLIERIVHYAYPEKKILNYTVLAGGCANLNIKIQLISDAQPLILRVYLRDLHVGHLEKSLGVLLSPDVPAPTTFFLGEVDGYCFAFTQFMSGIPLRDLLVSEEPYDLHAIMYDVGKTLASIGKHTFSDSGCLDRDLKVTAHAEDLLDFSAKCLKNLVIKAKLSPVIHDSVQYFLNKYQNLLPAMHEKQLVHADFDPANIFVDYLNGMWRVSAVLDWEFAFSGSFLWDIANMLRYAHLMPPEFTSAFLKGVASNGMVLPKDWFIITRLMNLMSLLDCLNRADLTLKPNQSTDIYSLIEHILYELENAEIINQ